MTDPALLSCPLRLTPVPPGFAGDGRSRGLAPTGAGPGEARSDEGVMEIHTQEGTTADGRWRLQTFITTEKDRLRISTVYLGVPHGKPGDADSWAQPKCLFETMVFEGLGWDERNCWRYETEQEARTGHAAAVREYETLLSEAYPHRAHD